jgi:flavin reductase ActVB
VAEFGEPIPDRLSTTTEGLRDALSAFASGVTVITTRDAEENWWGFTATSFCSVSMDPPLVLFCLADEAECHAVFTSADRWVVNFVHAEHANLAIRFATRGADKFAAGEFRADDHGLPVLTKPFVALRCRRYASYSVGDHTVFIGEVEHIEHDEQALPTIYFRRNFYVL